MTMNTRKWAGRVAATITLLAAPGVLAQFVEPDVEVLRTYVAEVPGDGFGFVAESVGDLNRDRRPEYVIGAPGNQEGGQFAGKAYVYDGRTGAVLATFLGNPNDQLGFAVGAVGDVDKDRVPDYCIGGPGFFNAPAPNVGRVLVVSGRTHEVLHDLSGDPNTLFGYECNGGGDVNGDRRDDVLVGAIIGAGFQGKLHMFSGRDGSTLWTVDGQSPNGRLGSGVSESLGDLNHDRVPDFAVGDLNGGPGAAGQAYIVSGVDGSVLDTFDPGPNGATLGWFFVHNAGDVDRDRVDDVYVGDFSDSTAGPGGGRGYVFSGRDGSELLTFEAEAAGDGLGMGRGAGDLDCDRHDDVIVGAYLHGGAAAQGGKAYLYSGKDGDLLRTFTSNVAGAQIGFDVVTLGDVNGDRLTDFLLTGVDVAHVVLGIGHGRSGHHDDDDDDGGGGRACRGDDRPHDDDDDDGWKDDDDDGGHRGRVDLDGRD